MCITRWAFWIFWPQHATGAVHFKFCLGTLDLKNFFTLLMVNNKVFQENRWTAKQLLKIAFTISKWWPKYRSSFLAQNLNKTKKSHSKELSNRILSNSWYCCCCFFVFCTILQFMWHATLINSFSSQANHYDHTNAKNKLI